MTIEAENTYRDRIEEISETSLFDTLAKIIRNGSLPNNIDAVRIDVAFHTPHGWQPAITGVAVALEEGTKFDLSGNEVKNG